jgi:thiamine-monophosphate kinase
MTEDSILSKLRRHSRFIGDDCAIVRPRANEDLLFTTDFSIESVHFTRDQKAADIGYRALARSLSDIAAMGGRPRYCLVSLALAPWTDTRWIDAFYSGLLKLAGSTGTALAGGDLSHSGQLTIDVMVCGSIARGKALRRSGAKAGDTIYVSGPLGGWTHKPLIVPRLDLGRKLAGKAHSCMDISDGLALDLHRLCRESGVAADIETVPLLPGASVEQALHDGEDYELLYTAAEQVPGIPIGSIRKGRAGALTFAGKRLQPRGYDHTQHSS